MIRKELLVKHRIKRCAEKNSGLIKFTFFTTITLFFIVHMYCFVNEFVNHDDAILSTGGAGITSGRWLKNFICGFSSQYSMPWVNGSLSALYMSIAVCAVVELFGVKRKASAAAIAAVMCTYPVLACSIAYMYTIDGYAFSIMLVCIGAYLTQKFRFGWIVGSVMFSMSLGIYQAYLPLAAALMVFSLLFLFLQKKSEAKDMLFMCVRSALSLGIGVALYKIILELMLRITHNELSSYMGIDSMWDFSLLTIFERIAKAYGNFFNIYTINKFSVLKPTGNFTHWAAIITIFVFVIYSIIEQKIYHNVFRLIFVLLTLAAVPVSCAMVFVMSDMVHALMIYAMMVPFIASVVIFDILAEKKKDSAFDKYFCAAVCSGIAAFVAVFCYNGYIVTNKAYFKMDIVFKQNYAYVVKLTERIESAEGYELGMPVAFIGEVTEEKHPDLNAGFDDINCLIGIEDESTMLSDEYFRRISQYYIGTKIVLADKETVRKLAISDAVAEMDYYPSDGSIKVVDGVLAVNLSMSDEAREHYKDNEIVGLYTKKVNDWLTREDFAFDDPVCVTESDDTVTLEAADNDFAFISIAKSIPAQSICELSISISPANDKETVPEIFLYGKDGSLIKLADVPADGLDNTVSFAVPDSENEFEVLVFADRRGNTSGSAIKINHYRINQIAVYIEQKTAGEISP